MIDIDLNQNVWKVGKLNSCPCLQFGFAVVSLICHLQEGKHFGEVYAASQDAGKVMSVWMPKLFRRVLKKTLSEPKQEPMDTDKDSKQASADKEADQSQKPGVGSDGNDKPTAVDEKPPVETIPVPATNPPTDKNPADASGVKFENEKAPITRQVGKQAPAPETKTAAKKPKQGDKASKANKAETSSTTASGGPSEATDAAIPLPP